MKLPTDNTNNSEEQASTQNENNGDAAAVAGSQPGASSSSTGSAENSSNSTSQQSASSNQPGTQEVDFSEFLWMENEEEFDSQVGIYKIMQQLSLINKGGIDNGMYRYYNPMS